MSGGLTKVWAKRGKIRSRNFLRPQNCFRTKPGKQAGGGELPENDHPALWNPLRSLPFAKDPLPPLAARAAWFRNRIASAGTTQEVGFHSLARILDSFLRRLPVRNAARQIRILKQVPAAVYFRKRANRKRVGVDDRLGNLHRGEPSSCEMGEFSNLP